MEQVEPSIRSPQRKMRDMSSPPAHEKRKVRKLHCGYGCKVTIRLRGVSSLTFEGRLALVANPKRLVRFFDSGCLRSRVVVTSWRSCVTVASLAGAV